MREDGQKSVGINHLILGYTHPAESSSAHQAQAKSYREFEIQILSCTVLHLTKIQRNKRMASQSFGRVLDIWLYRISIPKSCAAARYPRFPSSHPKHPPPRLPPQPRPRPRARPPSLYPAHETRAVKSWPYFTARWTIPHWGDELNWVSLILHRDSHPQRAFTRLSPVK